MSLNTDIPTLFNAINEHSDKLLKCLQDEMTALNSNQYENLLSLAEVKQSIITRLDTLDNQRQQLTGNTDFTSFLQQQVNSQQLVKQWQATQVKIQACKNQNEINGRLLQRRNKLAREVMDIMTGHNSTNETTYGRNGQTQTKAAFLNKTQI
ncbi:MAG: flagellar protein FlgN [Gammaproteobacteria bacterium]|nr:flagellar protein FlgN [Gammaproteobacteria bacterium]